MWQSPLPGLLLKKNVLDHVLFQAHSTGDLLKVAWQEPLPGRLWSNHVLRSVQSVPVFWRSVGCYFSLPGGSASRAVAPLGLASGSGCNPSAAAYARGAGGHSAGLALHADLLSLLMVANALSIQRLLTRYRGELRFPAFLEAEFCGLGIGDAWADFGF